MTDWPAAESMIGAAAVTQHLDQTPLLSALIGVVGGVLLLWLATVGALYLAGRGEAKRLDLKDAIRLVPDILRLLTRLSKDPEVPRRVRLQLLALIAYLAMPFDLVPDFIPVVGYADDVVVVALALRAVVRHAGESALDRHWPGTPDGLDAVKRLARVRVESPAPD